MENNWVVYGSDYYHKEVANQMSKLPVGIYRLQQMDGTTLLYLTKLEDKFSLPSKIYGVEKDFIRRVEKTYAATEGNLGILLNGVKGTGKTVTAKQISNNLGLPVVIVSEAFEKVSDFINELQEDVVLFFDEYEKVYDDYDNSILTVMDGVLSNAYRKVFLLTTNKAYINENMLQRPGRIRYHKTFEDLPLKTIMEIVDDKLEFTEAREETIKFISELEIITIDIVSSIVEEVNIHEESPSGFKDVFNVQPMEDVFDVYEQLANGTTKLDTPRAKVSPSKPSKTCVGNYFHVNGENWGTIIEAIKDKGFKVRSHREEEDEEGGKGKKRVVIYLIERSVGIHQSFASGLAF